MIMNVNFEKIYYFLKLRTCRIKVLSNENTIKSCYFKMFCTKFTKFVL